MPSMIPTRVQQHTMHACTQACSLHADESETVADETDGRTVAFRARRVNCRVWKSPSCPGVSPVVSG